MGDLMLYSIPDYEPIHSLDFDGELGGIMGWHLLGHHDVDTVDLFMVTVAEEQRFRPRGYDVEQRWCRKVPIRSDFNDGFRYAYSSTPGPGAYPVTSIIEDVTWERWCLHHPDVIAFVGVPADHVLIDGSPDDLVHLCRGCSTEHFAAQAEASTRALALAGATHV